MSREVNGRILPDVGEWFEWRTIISGEEHAGFVRDVDSNVIYVKCVDCEDDVEHAVEA